MPDSFRCRQVVNHPILENDRDIVVDETVPQARERSREREKDYDHVGATQLPQDIH